MREVSFCGAQSRWTVVTIDAERSSVNKRLSPNGNAFSATIVYLLLDLYSTVLFIQSVEVWQNTWNLELPSKWEQSKSVSSGFVSIVRHLKHEIPSVCTCETSINFKTLILRCRFCLYIDNIKRNIHNRILIHNIIICRLGFKLYILFTILFKFHQGVTII